MEVQIEKIANTELEVLKILWEAKRAMTITEIRKILTEKTNWEAATIKTLVYRLCDKGALHAEKRGVFYYTPAITEQEYHDYATRVFVDKLFGGNVKNLVASLIGGNTLTENDINELRAMFKVGD